jgi:hypothetical protein
MTGILLKTRNFLAEMGGVGGRENPNMRNITVSVSDETYLQA